jgi:FkbH-like protein
MRTASLLQLTNEHLRFLLPLSGRVAKVLVTDLDNTLWGGVIGEDGLDGIKVGAEYPGAAYQALQRAMLDLSRRGVLLAICSKNNASDALEVLLKHPGMLLHPEHFAALRINWDDKATNLRQIAAELNIGVDALAFFDDNPVERERVRQELPEVFVIEVPPDPMDYARALREFPAFERLVLTEEDRERSRMYAEQRQRTELQQVAGTLEEYYRSLQMVITVQPLAHNNLERIAQLTQKTNQFNLTTRRYSEQQLLDVVSTGTAEVFGASVRDRFGDNGLVGVTIMRRAGEVCEIDTFLLSCRVIGRTVETGILAYLIEHARVCGAQQVIGWFIPTKKNAPAKDFLSRHGFELTGEEADGAQRWVLDLRVHSVAVPDWLGLETPNSPTQVEENLS